MKLYRQLIILGAAAGLMIPGCTPEEETLIDTGDELTITASAKDITLLESEGEQEALKLTWTPASNYGLDEEAEYTLEIAKADSDYEDGYSRMMGKSTFSITWTVEELNTFLTEQFNAESGTKTAYKARITATIYGRDDLTQTAEAEFSATTYSATSYTLYIDGSALTNPDAGQMTRGEAGQFTWTGVLEEGGIVFTVSEDSEWPCYGAGEGDGELKYFNEDPGSDITIKVATVGEYSVTADLMSLTYTLEPAEVPVPELLYISGEAVNVTDYTDAILMERAEAGIFRWNGWLEPDKGFRFITGKLSWWPAFVRDGNSGNGIRYFSTDPGDEYDLDFSYSGEAGWKLITVNINTMSITVEDGKDTGEPMPEMLVIGGTAFGSDSAWDFDSGSRTMTRTETGFEWTGDMERGTFRFAAQNDFWPGYVRDWESDDYWTLSALTDSPYYDLGFTVLKNGKYTVTVDFTTRKVELTCLEEYGTAYEENLYILFASEWNNDPIRTPMTKEGDGIFSWEGEVTVGDHEKIANGEFQIFTIPDAGNWWPRYTLTYTNDPDCMNRIDMYSYDPTESIDITESGTYRIEINLRDMTYTITEI